MKKDKQLTIKSPLSGSLDNQANHPNWEKARKIEFGKKEKFITKTGKELTIDRGGITDIKLAKILSSKQSQANKDVAITNYLFDRGLDNAGFLAEMFQFKGHLTKETREFKSQMRFDFENFVGRFTTFLRDSSDMLCKTLSLSYASTPLEIEKRIKESGSVKKAYPFLHETDARLALLVLIAQFNSEAELLDKAVKKITEQRERARGRGIYIDKLGRTHSLYDEDIYDIIQQEKEELKKNKKDVS